MPSRARRESAAPTSPIGGSSTTGHRSTGTSRRGPVPGDNAAPARWRSIMKWERGAPVAVFVVGGLGAPAGQSRQVEWFTYGGDPASSKFSPADDITPQNV